MNSAPKNDSNSPIEVVIKQINHLLDNSFTNLKDLEGSLEIFLSPSRGADGCLGECDSNTVDMRSTLLKELTAIVDRVSALNARIDTLDSRIIN